MSLENKQPVQAEPRLKAFGAPPPAPSGMRRLAPLMGVVAGGGLVAAVGFYALSIILPINFKPAVVAGQAAGDAIRAEIEAMREAKIDLERRLADATAQPQAKAQIDVATNNSVLQERTASVLPMTEIAGAADVVCTGANIISMLTKPQGWGHSTGDDLYSMAQKTGAVTCGMGNIIRQSNTANMLDAVHTVSSARGTPMSNGAIAVNAAPMQATPHPVAAASRPLPRNLAEVYAIATPSRHWPQNYVDKSVAYIRTLPDAVGKQLFANLTEDDGWDVLVDRVQAYQALPDAPLPIAAPTVAVPAIPPVRVTAAHPVAVNPAPAPSRYSAMQQGQIRIYSYRMPVDALRKVTDGLDMTHGYPDAWYARVASYQGTHGG